MKFDFTDKASYLAWRQEWRTNYAELTEAIRTHKRSRKQFIRTYKTTQGHNGLRSRELVSKLPNPEHGKCSLGQLSGIRLEASFQMEALKEAKELSWTLKQATKAANTQAAA